jgi:hypothetical protein
VTTHSIWIFIHIMLVVFSLGAELGIFVSAIHARSSARSFETRGTLLQVVGLLDLFPRFSFSLFLPVGVHLTQGLGLYPVTPGILVGSWLIALAGIVLTIGLYKFQGKRLGIVVVGIQTALHLVMGGVFVTIGVRSLATGAPLDQSWFAVKVLLFGLMFWTFVVVEIASRGLFEPFFAIGKLGSTPEREGLVRKYFNRSLIGVSVIYLEIAAIAFLGATKPFL